MTKHIRFTFGLALLCAAMSTAMFASENSYMYLVQGIPGLDTQPPPIQLFQSMC